MNDQQQSRADAMTETPKEAMDRLHRKFSAMSPFDQRMWLMRHAPLPSSQPAEAPADERAPQDDSWIDTEAKRQFAHLRDHDVWKNDGDFIEALVTCLGSWGLDMMTDDNTHDLYDLWLAARAAASPAADQPFHKLLAALIDIYDDERNNAPEDRCYVEGAWTEVINEARTALGAAQQPAQADAPATIPDECAASGASCSYAPEGRHGEMQCRYCGKAPADALDEEQRDALNEAICLANDGGLPGTADQLRSILALHEQADAPAEAREPVCKLCSSTGPDLPCAYPTEINRQQARRIAELESRLSVNPHPDDVAVDVFATVMKDKLAKARLKGRGGWQTCSPENLSWMLREHVEKGDPRDVANFCMMLWHQGSPITSSPGVSTATQLDKFIIEYGHILAQALSLTYYDVADRDAQIKRLLNGETDA
ncbi:hypothetical protein WM24_23560 [Burkholderia ubonensis]|uniref:hypothetical protein n=1 Tax=Burkholderia ubonensis TaxID=101571 RepID=UPI00075A1936|nr:hypothetical protein [Burkholderia ubonensis]KWN80818.1 hypothetical protein WM24_23560 [Burkholderia ubonensis]